MSRVVAEPGIAATLGDLPSVPSLALEAARASPLVAGWLFVCDSAGSKGALH